MRKMYCFEYSQHPDLPVTVTISMIIPLLFFHLIFIFLCDVLHESSCLRSSDRSVSTTFPEPHCQMTARTRRHVFMGGGRTLVIA